MAWEIEVVGRSTIVVLALSLLISGSFGAKASSVAAVACLAADANSHEPLQIQRVVDLCTSGLTVSELSQFIRAKLLETRGVAYRNRGDLELSLQDLNSAVELDKDNDAYLRMRAWTLRQLGRAADAERDYEQALAINPEWQGYLSRCVTRMDQEMYAGALEDCEKSLAMRRLGDGLYFSAMALHRLSRSEEALPRILEACGLDGAIPEHFLLLAEVQLKLAHHSNAHETARAALQKFPDDSNLRKKLLEMGL